MLGCAAVSITLIGYFCGNEQQVALRGTVRGIDIIYGLYYYYIMSMVRGDMKAEQVGVPASGGKKIQEAKLTFYVLLFFDTEAYDIK